MTNDSFIYLLNIRLLLFYRGTGSDHLCSLEAKSHKQSFVVGRKWGLFSIHVLQLKAAALKKTRTKTLRYFEAMVGLSFLPFLSTVVTFYALTVWAAHTSVYQSRVSGS